MGQWMIPAFFTEGMDSKILPGQYSSAMAMAELCIAFICMIKGHSLGVFQVLGYTALFRQYNICAPIFDDT